MNILEAIENNDNALVVALAELLDAFKRVDKGHGTDHPEIHPPGQWGPEVSATAGIRGWGNWVVPDDAEDDGDYDWEEPTQKTIEQSRAIVMKIASRHPDVTLELETSEKNWIIMHAKHRK